MEQEVAEKTERRPEAAAADCLTQRRKGAEGRRFVARSVSSGRIRLVVEADDNFRMNWVVAVVIGRK